MVLVAAACEDPRATEAGGPAPATDSTAPTASTAPPAPTTSRAARGNVRDGVYSSAQAERAAVVYAQACAPCHADDLRGTGIAPSLVGVGFLSRWEGRTLGDLSTWIQTEMPLSAPSSLSAATYLDIAAYILSENGFPSGTTDLPADPALLDEMAIGPHP